MTPTFESFQTAVQARSWYPVAGVVLWFLLKLWKDHLGGKLLPRVPEGWRWAPPLLIAAATGFVDGYLSGLPLRDAGLRALFALFAIALPAMGVQSAVKESPLGGPPGTLVAMLACVLPQLSGCSPTPAQAAEVQREACICPPVTSPPALLPQPGALLVVYKPADGEERTILCGGDISAQGPLAGRSLLRLERGGP